MPPVTRMLRGGRSGEVRLKLYLTLATLATAEPYDVRGRPPSSFYAETLGLPDPYGKGARRISDALQWLAREKFIALDRSPGLAAHVVMLDSTGTGGSYKPVDRGKGQRWVVVPLDLWRRHWIVRLSGTALAAFIALLELQGGRTTPCTISTERRKQYGLSDDSWTRASAELTELGLLTMGKKREGERFEVSRIRNTYLLHTAKLGDDSDEDASAGATPATPTD